ncbi:hypothetical protein HX004_14610 [Myroides sp. 1354]|uniref:hypothetical protein n=1 Tax=unclassified Myroides TaxID=2642485 RepID=UPI0025765E28|nr:MULTISPECIES: hypothetical protein [unclassified Myroides]MDM1046059.1 hypothetical protein [Myroides sp. R163-1]MDM1056995.1 hypothetical protein [Myroides sp. 1354]MDM1070190.1 hypothetical protein [Myroides sp. 1372]
MNTFLKKLSFSFLFMAVTSTAFAQEAPTRSYDDPNKLYMGLGLGLDYGGIGGKIEYLPVKNIGVFAGLGYNLEEAGWNIGASYKIKASERLSVNPTVLYGYNGVLKVDGASEYNMVSYGMSFGVNVDIHVGKQGNKITTGFFIPVRSQKFRDNYDAVKDDPYISMDNELFPFTVGVGYNWRLN